MRRRNGKPYMVSADTLEMPGKVVCVTVALTKEIIGPGDSVRVDLVDHPLYRHIHDYCKNNPPNPFKGEKP